MCCVVMGQECLECGCLKCWIGVRVSIRGGMDACVRVLWWGVQ